LPRRFADEDLELFDKLCLELGESLVVLRSDGDAIHVRDVGTAKRDGLTVFHHAQEALADLDGMHSRLEQPGEESVHGALQTLFELADQAHGTSSRCG
jgi:hypothetical protein